MLALQQLLDSQGRIITSQNNNKPKEISYEGEAGRECKLSLWNVIRWELKFQLLLRLLLECTKHGAFPSYTHPFCALSFHVMLLKGLQASQQSWYMVIVTSKSALLSLRWNRSHFAQEQEKSEGSQWDYKGSCWGLIHILPTKGFSNMLTKNAEQIFSGQQWDSMRPDKAPSKKEFHLEMVRIWPMLLLLNTTVNIHHLFYHWWQLLSRALTFHKQ